MKHQLQLTDAEWAMVLELLQVERRESSAEVNDVDSPQADEQLEERLKLVDQLIERLQQQDQGVH